MSLAALFVLPASAAEDEEPDGRLLGLSCAACHGTGGTSPGSIPHITGKSATYFEETLLAFKYDRKEATVMNRIAKGYSDEEIQALARHFGGR